MGFGVKVQASAQKLFRVQPCMGTLKPGETQEGTGDAALTPLHKIVVKKSKLFAEDPNLLKLRSLDSSCLFFLSDYSIWGQETQMLQMP